MMNSYSKRCMGAKEPGRLCSIDSCKVPLTSAYCHRTGFCVECMKATSLPPAAGKSESRRFCQQVRRQGEAVGLSQLTSSASAIFFSP